MRKTLAALAGLGLFSLTSFAADLPPVEQSVEATTESVSIPNATGTIVARSCTECPSRNLTLTSATRFYVGQAELAFDEFKKSLNRIPPPGLTIHYRAEDNTVTRVVASGQ